jgi:hypothetical protein
MLSALRLLGRAVTILAFFSLLGCNKPSPSLTPKIDSATTWSLESSESDALAAPYKMEEFEIRPPKTFRFITHDTKSQSYYWVGPVRDDETYGQLIVIITELSEEQAKLPLESLFGDSITAIKRKHDECSNSEVQRGAINGHAFVRATWKGTANSTARKGLVGRELHGVIYFGLYGKRAVQIMCQDVAPAHDASLRAGELAASTLRFSASKGASP